jgi:hypothetical protein
MRQLFVLAKRLKPKREERNFLNLLLFSHRSLSKHHDNVKVGELGTS